LKKSMDQADTIIAVFPNHEEADKAVQALAAAGIGVKNMSVVGKGYHTEEKVMGFYNMGDRMQMWGSRGAFWGGLWGLLFGGVFMVVPVFGQVVVLGYLATAVISALEGALVLGSLSALGGAISSIGVPEDSVVRYETDVKADSFLVMAHGTAEEIEKARGVLNQSDPSRLDVYNGLAA
jgi:uncharacterized membrane protein